MSEYDQDEITVSIDGVEVGTAENVVFTEDIEHDTIQSIKEALKQMNAPMLTFSKAVYEALEDKNSPSHEVVTKLIWKKSKEEKLPEKLRKGWS